VLIPFSRRRHPQITVPAPTEITPTLLRENIDRAAGDVFQTMLGLVPNLVDVTELSPRHDRIPLPEVSPGGRTSLVVGAVGFLGENNGLTSRYLDETFARLSTGQILGMTATELINAGDERVNDAVGEITNMTVGRFKNGLCEAGFPCILTTPSDPARAQFLHRAHQQHRPIRR
jgi:chemotaxis protein CheX